METDLKKKKKEEKKKKQILTNWSFVLIEYLFLCSLLVAPVQKWVILKRFDEVENVSILNWLRSSMHKMGEMNPICKRF